MTIDERSHNKSKRFFHLHHHLTFGKYKSSGLTVEQIIIDDPEYMRWVVDNVEWMSLDGDAQELLDSQPENRSITRKNNVTYYRHRGEREDW